jgi:hypothetical protein
MRISAHEFSDIYTCIGEYCQNVVDDYEGDEMNVPLIVVVPAGDQNNIRYFRICLAIEKMKDEYNYIVFNIELTDIDEYLDAINISNQN